MPEIGMYFNKAEVDEGILLGRFKRFADIPEQFLDDNVAIEWLKFAGSPIEKHYAQVPQQWRSDAFLKFAAFNGAKVLKDTSPNQTGCYRDLVHLCAENDSWSLRDVHPRFREEEIKRGDDDLLGHVLARLGYVEFLRLIREIDWVGPAMSDRMVNECCTKDLEFSLGLPPEVRRKDISEFIKPESPRNLLQIRACGQLGLLASKISQVGWPTKIGAVYPIETPSSLGEAVEGLRESGPGDFSETLHMGFIMTFLIEDVVPAMKGGRLKKLLTEMYSKEALEPYWRHDNGLKGVFLDDALGL